MVIIAMLNFASSNALRTLSGMISIIRKPNMAEPDLFPKMAVTTTLDFGKWPISTFRNVKNGVRKTIQ